MTTNRRIVKTEGPDFYPTPCWATEALMKYENFIGDVWEPCCGDGAMAEVLKEKYEVIASDKFDRGYGHYRTKDFLETETKLGNNIITNPPFNISGEMVVHALELTKDVPKSKVAFLLRTAFLESQDRYNTIFSINPPNRVYVFSERLSMYPAGHKGVLGGGTTSYSWFVWEHGLPKKSELRWIAPGMKPKGKPRN